MNGNKYSVSIKTRVDASPEETAHHLAAGRRQAGNKLYNILYSQKLPAVVDIEEISISVYKHSHSQGVFVFTIRTLP